MNFFRNLFGKAPKGALAAPFERELQEAKRIFFEYSCNHYYMSREAVNFKRFHISQEQENIWRNEFITHWKSKLSTDNLDAVHKLEAASAIEAVPDLLVIAQKGDSYVKLWIANAIWSTSFKTGIDASPRKQAREAAITLLRSIIKGPVQLSENNRRKIYGIALKNLGASTPEEYIVNYAKRILKEAQKGWYLRLLLISLVVVLLFYFLALLIGYFR